MSQCEVRSLIVGGGYIDNLLAVWARRFMERHVLSFVTIIFKVNLFPCLMSTGITALATRRLTPAFIFKVNRS